MVVHCVGRDESWARDVADWAGGAARISWSQGSLRPEPVLRRIGELLAGWDAPTPKRGTPTGPAVIVACADEVLTPDSSRFWDADLWRPGESLPSFDKQYVRDWLAEQSGWDRETTPPELPAEVVEATRARYVEAYERLTGRSFREIPAV